MAPRFLCVGENRLLAEAEGRGGTCPSCGEALFPAVETVGDFVLSSKLGEGGMGVVWKAWQRSLSRWVALKLLQGLDSEGVERFLRESRIAAALRHPNIVPVYEAGTAGDGRPYLCMPVIDGTPLAKGTRGIRTSIEHVRDAALAIHHAHEQGVIHRDLKPQNILVDKQGSAHVMDFGLAKSVRSGDRLTVTGEILGTPAYMSPEQARGETSTLGPATDVYGLGATLYALLAGGPPFEGSTALDILRAVTDREPRRLRARNPRVSRDVETIVAKAMDKDSRRRYASAREFADDLQRYLEGRPIHARPAGPGTIAWKWIRRNRAISGAAALVVLAIAAGIGLAVRSERGKREVERSQAEREERRRHALPHLVQAAQRIEDARNVLFQEGSTLADLTKILDLAEGDVSRALAEDDASGEAHFLLGRILRMGWKLPEARAEFDLALRLQPAHVGARLGRMEIDQQRMLVLRFEPAPAAQEELKRIDAGHRGDLETLRRSSEARPDQLLYAEAMSFTAFAEWPAAIEAWTRLIAAEPGRVEYYKYRGDSRAQAWLQAGEAARKKEDFEGAERDFAEATRRCRGFYEAYHSWGWLYYKSPEPARFRESIEERYAECRRIHPGYVPAYLDHIEFLRSNDPDDRHAIPLLEALARLLPDSPVVPLLLGVCRHGIQDFEGALADFDRALAIQDRPDVRLHRAITLLFSGREREAEEQFSALVSEPVLGPYARLDRGAVRGLLLHDRDGERADYDETIRALPDLAEARLNRALTAIVLQRDEDAFADLGAILAEAPRDHRAGQLRAALALAEGRSPDALRDLRFCEASPMNLNNLGMALRLQGDLDRAVETLDRGLDVTLRDDPGKQGAHRSKATVPALYANRGLTRWAQGDAKAAEADFARALEISPKHAYLRMARSKALRNLGRNREADEDAALARAGLPAVERREWLGEVITGGSYHLCAQYGYELKYRDYGVTSRRMTGYEWQGVTFSSSVAREK